MLLEVQCNSTFLSSLSLSWRQAFSQSLPPLRSFARTVGPPLAAGPQSLLHPCRGRSGGSRWLVVDHRHASPLLWRPLTIPHLGADLKDLVCWYIASKSDDVTKETKSSLTDDVWDVKQAGTTQNFVVGHEVMPANVQDASLAPYMEKISQTSFVTCFLFLNYIYVSNYVRETQLATCQLLSHTKYFTSYSTVQYVISNSIVALSRYYTDCDMMLYTHL